MKVSNTCIEVLTRMLNLCIIVVSGWHIFQYTNMNEILNEKHPSNTIGEAVKKSKHQSIFKSKFVTILVW